MRLIDADKLINTLKMSKHMIYYANATVQIIQNNEIERCISFVETAPTITIPTAELDTTNDFAEWIDVNGDGSLWKCSSCGETSCCRGKYCSDCGKTMRKLPANYKQVKEGETE